MTDWRRQYMAHARTAEFGRKVDGARAILRDAAARNLPLGFARAKGLDVRRALRASLTPPYFRRLDANTHEVAAPWGGG